MKTQLKYLKLFEGISHSDIPYIIIHSYLEKRSIHIPTSTSITELPEIYNQLTDEVNWYIKIYMANSLKYINSFNNLKELNNQLTIRLNSNLTHITGFNNLTKIEGDFLVESNEKLEHITGFNSLTKIGNWMYICGNLKLTHIPGFNNLTKIEGEFLVESNEKLEHITGFNSLTKIGDDISIRDNPNLTHITGFNSLTEINGNIWLSPKNKKLIPMSIPYTILKSVDYVEGGIYVVYKIGEIKSKSPVDFINHPNIVNECIYKFDPAIHPDVVVKQIIENLEVWGEPDTIKTIINHILSKGDYWEYIPESMKQYVEEKYIHLYNSKYANTGARSIAKMNTGRYLGMF